MGGEHSGKVLEDSEGKDHRLNKLINDKGACRTAPATPCLLTIESKLFSYKCRYPSDFFFYAKPGAALQTPPSFID